jgi:hypothetical protein
MDWRKGLTEKEKKHLREVKIKTKDQSKKQAESLSDNSGIPDCWECRMIARKLKIIK